MKRQRAGKRVLAWMTVSLLLAAHLLVAHSSAAAADLANAHEFVARIGTGWNLGNTFDAFNANQPVGRHANTTADSITAIETSWLDGAANVTTQSLIQELKHQGFGTIRIPVTWHKVANPSNNWLINEHWMARVKQVVDWALEEEMFVILNTHHENRVLNLGSGDASQATHAGNIFVRNIWEQIAEAFKDYDERLILAGLNEPRHEGGQGEWNGGTVEVRRNVNHLNQVFVDMVRASGGNNTNRFLMVPTVAAGSNNNAMNGFRVPVDLPQHRTTVTANNVGYVRNANDAGNTISGTNISSSRIIFSVHTYSPFAWAHDGQGSYGAPGLTTLRSDLNSVQTRANALGLPVIMGEWGSTNNASGPGANQTLRNEQRPQHAEDYIREARERGMVAVWWDNGGFESSGGHSFGIIRRNPPHSIAPNHQDLIDAITGVPQILSVTVDPPATSVEKGLTQQFTATVEGTNNPSQGVAWDIVGNSATGTSIDSSGLLTVAIDENEAALTVRATSAANRLLSGTAMVTLSSVSIHISGREIPGFNSGDDNAAITPVNVLTGGFTAGPNPVSRQSGMMSFFWQGRRVDDGELTIFDASGNIVNRIVVDDCVNWGAARNAPAADSAEPRRVIATWGLTDRNGRIVSEGAYLVKGVIVTSNGKRERVSLMVGVR
ncbi:MAG: cellulase family glycosylhydrolase [Chitinispirillales bacterium]|jgi:endoglucanase|nr:cellulase family glycosylhydrolase [Chitinispirillales bacterium]